MLSDHYHYSTPQQGDKSGPISAANRAYALHGSLEKATVVNHLADTRRLADLS